MSFFSSFFSPTGINSHTPLIQQPTFNLLEMLKKAEVYAKDDNRLLNYISNILKDIRFQNNQQIYLQDWREKRSKSGEIKYPDDQAYQFFEQHFKF